IRLKSTRAVPRAEQRLVYVIERRRSKSNGRFFSPGDSWIHVKTTALPLTIPAGQTQSTSSELSASGWDDPPAPNASSAYEREWRVLVPEFISPGGATLPSLN